MAGHRIKLTGYRIDKKTGKPVKSSSKLSVSKQIAQRKSKKISVKRRSIQQGE